MRENENENEKRERATCALQPKEMSSTASTHYSQPPKQATNEPMKENDEDMYGMEDESEVRPWPVAG